MRSLRCAALISTVASVAGQRRLPPTEPEPEPEPCHDDPVCVANTYELVHVYGFPCDTLMAEYGFAADATHPNNVLSECLLRTR